MNARLIWAAVAFLAAGNAAAFALRRPPPGGARATAAEPRAGAFDTLIVEKDGARTTLLRRADGIWVKAPVASAADSFADPAAAPAAFGAIDKLDPGALVTTRAARYPELGVELGGGGGHGIGVVAARGQHAVLSLVIGKTVGSGTMVRVRGASGPDPIWQVNGDLRAIFDKGTADWRDRSVTTFPAADVREIAVDASDGDHVAVRRDPGGDEAASPHGGGGAASYRVVSASPGISTLDQSVPAEIVATMAALKASDFADGGTPAMTGLAPPRLIVTITLQGGEKDRLLIGDDASADEVFVKTPDSAQIFRVKRFNIERVARRPIQFRSKLLCDLPEADVDTISVSRGADSFTLVRVAGVWRAKAPRGLIVDPDKVVAFPTVFRGWRAPRIAEDARDREGIGAPAVLITGRTKSAGCTIAAAPHPRERDAYLVRTLPDPGETFVVPGWMIDRIAVPLDTLRAH